MRILKWVLGIVVIVALVVGIGGMLLPREVIVARTLPMNAPASKVFPLVNSMQATGAWSPWMDIDPDMKTTFSGPEAGVGNKLSWTSDHPKVGNGTQEITLSEQDKRVVTALDFGDMGLAEAQFVLSADGDRTSVTWLLKADMGAGPIGRWMGLMMDKWVGADYETGLFNLKNLVEG